MTIDKEALIVKLKLLRDEPRYAEPLNSDIYSGAINNTIDLIRAEPEQATPINAELVEQLQYAHDLATGEEQLVSDEDCKDEELEVFNVIAQILNGVIEQLVAANNTREETLHVALTKLQERFEAGMKWSPRATEYEKTLVKCNLNGFVSFLAKESQLGALKEGK